MNLPAKPVTVTHPLMDEAAFAQMQRVGSMLAMSPLFPDHLRKGSKEEAIANGTLVMNMAVRLNEDPLTIAQNIFFVSGKPSWSSSYMIGKANQHGVFRDPISWDISGEGDDLSVTAYAVVAATGKRVEATCDMAMAKAENWVKNPKYKSMPVQMLRYRSATFLIRLYAPEVMVGIPSQVEVELGMKDITPTEYAEAKVAESKPEPEKPQDAEIIEDEPKPKADKPKAETKAKGKEPEPKSDDKAASEDVKPEPKDTPDPEQFKALYDMIVGDMNQAPTVDHALELYEAQIKQMKEFAPDLHADLQKEIEAFRENEKEEG